MTEPFAHFQNRSRGDDKSCKTCLNTAMTIAENLRLINASIAKTARENGRDGASVQLVAVSKQQPADRITEALAAGQRVFGENRVQEAKSRWSDLRQAYPDLRLHLIGPLQTNKVKDAVALFDVIETVDRAALVSELVAEMKKQNRAPRCLIQVNSGAEEQKSGVLPHDLPALLQLCTDQGLKISGLMCIPPVNDPPGLHFALLHKLALRHGLPDLSMGMSHDYKLGIMNGATLVRVGTALFGERPAHDAAQESSD